MSLLILRSLCLWKKGISNYCKVQWRKQRISFQPPQPPLLGTLTVILSFLFRDRTFHDSFLQLDFSWNDLTLLCSHLKKSSHAGAISLFFFHSWEYACNVPYGVQWETVDLVRGTTLLRFISKKQGPLGLVLPLIASTLRYSHSPMVLAGQGTLTGEKWHCAPESAVCIVLAPGFLPECLAWQGVLRKKLALFEYRHKLTVDEICKQPLPVEALS